MARERELDLEVLEAGVAYTLYASALVALAVALKNRIDPNQHLQAVDKYAHQLNDALVRCGIHKDVPVKVGDAEDILRLLENGQLMLEISSLLVGQHSHRQELIFILTCLVGGVIVGSTSGVQDATGPVRSQATVIADDLGLPESVITSCFATETLTPLRDSLHSAGWSEIIEVKPSLWGFSFDVKKLLSILRRLFLRKRTS